MEEQELHAKYQQSTGESPITSDFIRWRQHYLEKNLTIWEEKYPFLERSNVYLVAMYDRKMNRQKMVIQEFCEYSHEFVTIDGISCIHTAITQKPAEYMQQNADDPEFHKEILELWSSENRKEVQLSPTEKFFALKSWVQGIAQAGYEALIIQREIESYAHLVYPISQFLFRAMMKIDTNLTIDFIKWMRNRCIYDGDPHLPSLTANLLFVINALQYKDIGRRSNWDKYQSIVDTFLMVVEYALDSKLNSKKFLIEPVNELLKFVGKFQQEQVMLQYLNQVCDMFQIEDIIHHPVLCDFITPLLDSLTCRFWVIQELINHLEDILKFESLYSEDYHKDNEVKVKLIAKRLTSIGIRKKEIVEVLESLQKDGTIVCLATINKRKKGLLAVPFEKYTVLKKIQYQILKRLQFPLKTLPPPMIFFKSNKYRYIFEQQPKIFIESGWYWFYDVWINGQKQYAIENRKKGEVYLNVSMTGISRIEEIDGLTLFDSRISHLDISHNNIDDLSEITQFPALTYLDLRDNPINVDYLRELYELINTHAVLVTLKVDPEMILEVARFLPQKIESKMMQFCHQHWEKVFGTPLELELEEETEFSNKEIILKQYVQLYNEGAELEPPVHIVSLINFYYEVKQKYIDFWHIMQVLS